MIVKSFILYRKGGAIDSNKRKIKLYKDIREIFADLRELGIPVAGASRCADYTLCGIP